jgi:hypothetical protein
MAFMLLLVAVLLIVASGASRNFLGTQNFTGVPGATGEPIHVAQHEEQDLAAPTMHGGAGSSPGAKQPGDFSKSKDDIDAASGLKASSWGHESWIGDTGTSIVLDLRQDDLKDTTLPPQLLKRPPPS